MEQLSPDQKTAESKPASSNSTMSHSVSNPRDDRLGATRNDVGMTAEGGALGLNTLVKEIKWTDTITASATALIAVLTVFYVYYARRQWETMDMQLEAMRATIVQNRFAIRESISQTKAAQRSADAAIREADIASEALKSDSDSFRLSMRPYLAASTAEFLKKEVDKQLQIRCVLKNAGKIPALNAHGLANVILHDKSRPLILPPPTTVMKTGPDIGIDGVAFAWLSNDQMSEVYLNAIGDSTHWIFLYYGEVRYGAEIFTSTYTEKFCFQWDPNENHFVGCHITAYNKVLQIY